MKKDGVLELFNSLDLEEYKTLGNKMYFYDKNYHQFDYISEYKFYIGCIVDFKENEFSIKANLLLEIPKITLDKEFKNLLKEEKFIEIRLDITKGLTNPETSTLIRSGKNKKSKDARKLYEIVYVSINENGKIIEYKNAQEISSKEQFERYLKCFNETRNAYGLNDYVYNQPQKQLSTKK